MLVASLSSVSSTVTFPRGPVATSTASVVGFVQLTDSDVFYSDTLVRSNQFIVTTASDASVNINNAVANASGSTSAYSFMAAMLLQKQSIVQNLSTSSITGRFIDYLTYWRNSSDLNDIQNDTKNGLGNVGVISVKKIKYGESIQPLSFTASTSAGVIFVDSTSSNKEFGILTRKSDGASAGLIFYQEGIALIHGPSVSAVQTISALTSVNVTSTYKIWQLNAFCTAAANELNYSNNTNSFYVAAITADPRFLQDPSLSAFTYGYQWGLINNSSSADKGNFYLKNLFWNTNAYITSCGLYNDNNELLAIAKLAQPIRKPSTIPFTFRVTIDFD